jgi:hypothetical protein
MFDDGVFHEPGGAVEMAPDWREALERVRERTDEDGDNRRQRERYARNRAAFRERLEAERRGEAPTPERVPDLVGPERNAEVFAAAKERDHAARVEEQRRKVGTTAETFLADALEGVSGFAFVQLLDLWAEKGGKRADLWRVARAPGGAWTLRREGGDGLLYVERRAAGSDVRTQKTREGESHKATPKRADAEVLPMPDPGVRPDPFRNTSRNRCGTSDAAADAPRRLPPKGRSMAYGEGVYVHGSECACSMCEDEAPAGRGEIGASA